MSTHRKNSFMLTEMLIAISLFAILLSVLFGIFWRYVKTDEMLAKKRTEFETILTSQARIQKIFSTKNDKGAYFYLENPESLVFTFENDAELASELPMDVLAKLYIEEDTLYLALWSRLDPTMRFRKEKILDNIDSVRFEFFKAPSEKKVQNVHQKTQENPEAPEGHWIHYWPKNFKATPTLLKIITTNIRDGKNTTFWFIIPDEIKTVIYNTK